MCWHIASRGSVWRRCALQTGIKCEEVFESPDANNVTWWPRRTSSSVRQETIRSVPPYWRGGTLSKSGDTWAMRMGLGPEKREATEVDGSGRLQASYRPPERARGRLGGA